MIIRTTLKILASCYHINMKDMQVKIGNWIKWMKTIINGF